MRQHWESGRPIKRQPRSGDIAVGSINAAALRLTLKLERVSQR
jgi:hypothetical protein